MKIAAFINAQGEMASLYQPGVIRVFERGAYGWQPVRDIAFALDREMGLSEMRAHTLAMLASLDGCRHFIARTISGAMLSYFDGMGIVMWKLAGDPTLFLSQIERIVAERAARERPTTLPNPFVAPGEAPDEYRVNLIDVLKSDGGLTSKQVLLPFLRQTRFARLEIVCDHLPKWFKRELPLLKLAINVEDRPDGRCCAIIYPASATLS